MWTWKLVTAPLRIMTSEEMERFGFDSPRLYEDNPWRPLVCVGPLIERFNFPLDAKRYWLELADKPSPDGHCWPVWLKEDSCIDLFLWRDGELPLPKETSDWDVLHDEAGDLLATIPLADTPRKFYLSIYYEE